MSVETYNRNTVEDLLVYDRTPEQESFYQIMSRLDLLKFSSGVRIDDLRESWSHKMKLNVLRGLSENTSLYFHNPRSVTIFVEYGLDQRKIGLKSEDKELLYVLNKDDQTCRGAYFEKSSQDGQWKLAEEMELPPVTDAEVLTAEAYKRR